MDVILAEGKHTRLISRDGWEFVQRTNITGIVVIVAVTNEEKLLIVEQYRAPVAARVLELPAGLAGDITGQEDEGLALAAQRELVEETGFVAQKMERLLEGPISAGLSDEVITLFRATGLRQVGPGGGDSNEDITVHEVPLDCAAQWLREANARGVLVDPKVLAGLYYGGR